MVGQIIGLPAAAALRRRGVDIPPYAFLRVVEVDPNADPDEVDPDVDPDEEVEIDDPDEELRWVWAETASIPPFVVTNTQDVVMVYRAAVEVVSVFRTTG